MHWLQEQYFNCSHSLLILEGHVLKDPCGNKIASWETITVDKNEAGGQSQEKSL